MCYHLHARVKTQLKRAKEQGLLESADKWIKENKVNDQYHVSGFNHPVLLVYPHTSPSLPTPMSWGLVPHWVKSEQDKLKRWNSTLNCRGESMFEKPSFKEAALYNRCLLYVDGFYEYHHFQGKKYPYYVHLKDQKPLCLGGLWSEWLNPNTGEVEKSFTIVTTKGNSLLSKIHNNPQLEGPRMPVILEEESAEEWIKPEASEEKIQQLLLPYSDTNMDAYTVGPLHGKHNLGNQATTIQPVRYGSLEQKVTQQSLDLFD